MVTIAIAVKHEMSELQKRLNDSMFFFHSDGLKTTVEEYTIDGWPHLRCRLLNDNTTLSAEKVSLFRYFLAGVLTDFIVECQVEPYFDEILAQSYYYFPCHERQDILGFAKHNYDRDKENENSRAVYSEIKSQVTDYIRQNDYLNIHGLIIFRLKLWREYLGKKIDLAVDDFLMEKEYQEFIKLLKYFVEMQEPKINQVNVTLDKDGKFCLLNLNYERIEDSGDDEWERVNEESSQEDLLVSTLITVAPHQIVLHKPVYTQYPRATDTLRHVFEKRVILCKNCKLCHDESSHLHLKRKN